MGDRVVIHDPIGVIQDGFIVLNPDDAVSAHLGGKLWFLDFGSGIYEYILLFWDDGSEGEEGAFDAAIRWLSKNVPSYFMSFDNEDIADMTETQRADYVLRTPYGYIDNYDWGMEDLAPGHMIYNKAFEQSIDEVLAKQGFRADESYIREVNKMASRLGLGARWEIQQ
jgi:hypothetical protein